MLRSLAFRAGLALALLAALPARAAVTFAHALSIYEDDKKTALKDVDGVACGPAGRVVIADSGNGRLLSLVYAQKQVTGISEWRIPQLPYPTELQLDGKGNVLVLDRKAQRIGRVSDKGAFLGFVDVRGEGLPGAVIPGSFKLDASDNLYVHDLRSEKVLVADATGAVQRQIALPRGKRVFTDIAVDPAGTVYALDCVSSAVYAAGRGDKEFKPLTQGLKDSMTFPAHVTVSGGRLFVVDQHGHGIVVLGLDGTFQGRFLSAGVSDGAIYYPSQLCITDDATAFLADRYNNRVQVYTMTR